MIDAFVAASIQAMKDAQKEKAALMAQDFARLLSFPAGAPREDYISFLSAAASRGTLDPSFLGFLEDFVVDDVATATPASLARSCRLHLAFVAEYGRGCAMAMLREPSLSLDAPASTAVTSWPILLWADAYRAVHPDKPPSRHQQPRKRGKGKGGRPAPPAKASTAAPASALRAAPPPAGGRAPRSSQT
jgi:hypothetical protein